MTAVDSRLPADLPAPPSLAQIRQAGELLHQALNDAVVRLRLHGGSWTDVGRALGISRQAARLRFRHLDEESGVSAIELRVSAGRSAFVSVRLGEDVATDPAARRLVVLAAGQQLRTLTA